jgi:hypothetical protein
MKFMLNYILLQEVMNPVGESSVPKGRGRGLWHQGQDRKELRRPQVEKRIGMQGTKVWSKYLFHTLPMEHKYVTNVRGVIKKYLDWFCY